MDQKKKSAKELWGEIRELDNWVEPYSLGPYCTEQLIYQPRHLLFSLARYKHASKLLPIKVDRTILELGCSEGLGSYLLAENAAKVVSVDFDELAVAYAKENARKENIEFIHDDFLGREFGTFDGIVSLDVIEHIEVDTVHRYFETCVANIAVDGVCVIGTPNETAYKYASKASRLGHINNYTAERLHDSLKEYFNNVFIFGLNDETLHTGFFPMCHYLLAVACNPK